MEIIGNEFKQHRDDKNGCIEINDEICQYAGNDKVIQSRSVDLTTWGYILTERVTLVILVRGKP